MKASRREFLLGAAAFAALPPLSALGSISPASVPIRRSEEQQGELIDKWDEATGLVTPQDYKQYLRDGKTRGFKALEGLERAFGKVMGTEGSEHNDTVAGFLV